MRQSNILSTESATIVKNFVNRDMFTTLNAQRLITSLYRLMPHADQRVLTILKDQICPLEDSLTQQEIERLMVEYPAVARECYKWMDDRSSTVAFRTKGITHLNSAYIELSMVLAEPEENKRVFVPYTGEGRFLPWLSQTDITGYEPNEKAWALAKVFQRPQADASRITLGDYADCQEAEGQSYDYIFAFPPMGKDSDERSVYETMRRLITDHLNDLGTFSAILPYSFCYGTNSLCIRELLRDEQKRYSMAVIKLPSVDVYQDTAMPLCIVIVTSNHLGNVLLMDADSKAFVSLTEQYDTYQPALKIQSIVETIKMEDEQYVWYRSVDELSDNLNLQPSRYLIDQYLPKTKEGEKLMPLSELITLLPTVPVGCHSDQEPMGIPLVSIKQLTSSEHDYMLRRDELPINTDRSCQGVYEDCLLLRYLNRRFLVGKLTGVAKERPVGLKDRILPIRISSEKITEEYLMHALLSPDTELQAEKLSQGVVIPNLTIQDLMSIRIVVPSLDRQVEIFKEETRASISEAYQRLSDAHESFRQEIHMQKHAIGQTIMNFNNWWRVLQQARQKEEGVLTDTTLVGKSHPTSVAQIFENLEHSLKKLQTQIYTLDRGNGLEVKTFALTEFIEDYIANPENQSPLFSYLYDKSLHHAEHTLPDIIEAGEPLEYVDFAPEALKIIFDNIMSNAVSHAFDPNQPKPGLIKIELTSEGKNHIVTISNNGKPLDKRLTAKEVFVYNRSTKPGENHFGIGGYEIDWHMREFGGEALFESHPESQFPVAYKLIFHNTNIIDSL